MTYKEIKESAPEEFEARKNNKLTYRYPRGESYVSALASIWQVRNLGIRCACMCFTRYLDVISRLDPIIHEIERARDPILIIAHQGILRVIYAYVVCFIQRDQ
mgnify:CR=1 FL=1